MDRAEQGPPVQGSCQQLKTTSGRFWPGTASPWNRSNYISRGDAGTRVFQTCSFDVLLCVFGSLREPTRVPATNLRIFRISLQRRSAACVCYIWNDPS